MRVLKFLLCVLAVLATSTPLFATPPLTSSEETSARICRDWDDSWDGLIEHCQTALGAVGLSINDRVEMLGALGNALMNIDQHDESREVFEEALALDPDAPDALNGLGWVAWMEDEEATAAKFFQRSLDVHPSAENLAGLASSLWATGEFEAAEAIEYLELSLALDPEYTWAMREAGWIEYDAGNLRTSIMWYDRALAVFAGDGNATLGLSYSYNDLGLYPEAFEAISTAIDLGEDGAAALSHRMVVLGNLGRFRQVLSRAEEFVALWPEDTEGYIQTARAHEALGRRGVGIAYLEETIGQHDGDNYFFYWYADLLVSDRQDERALAAINSAIALPGADFYDYQLKAYIALELDDNDLALEAALASVEDNAQDPYSYFYVAMAEAGLGHGAKGLAAFDRAMKAGLPEDLVGDFAAQLVGSGLLRDALAVRLKY